MLGPSVSDVLPIVAADCPTWCNGYPNALEWTGFPWAYWMAADVESGSAYRYESEIDYTSVCSTECTGTVGYEWSDGSEAVSSAKVAVHASSGG